MHFMHGETQETAEEEPNTDIITFNVAVFVVTVAVKQYPRNNNLNFIRKFEQITYYYLM